MSFIFSAQNNMVYPGYTNFNHDSKYYTFWGGLYLHDDRA